MTKTGQLPGSREAVHGGYDEGGGALNSESGRWFRSFREDLTLIARNGTNKWPGR